MLPLGNNSYNLHELFRSRREHRTTITFLLILLPLCFAAAAHADLPPDSLGPIRVPRIVPIVDGEGVQAGGYHTNRHTIVPLPGTAPWIWTDAPDTDADRPPVTCFRRTLNLDKAPEHADAWICADRHYRLWINGRIVARGPADPGEDYPGGKNRGNSGVYFCDYRNIAPYLYKGVNLIAAEVFTDRLSDWYGSSGHHGFMFKAVITDGRRHASTFESDGAWKAMPYELTQEPETWRLATYDDSHWLPCARIDGTPWPKLLTSRLDTPLEADYPFNKMVRDTADPTGRPPKIEPSDPYVFRQDGSFALRCDRVISGYVTLVIQGGTGAHLTVALNELDAPGGRRSTRLTLTGGELRYETPYYSSFSTVNVTAENVTTPVTIERLDAVFISDPVEYVGSFSCSDDRLDRLWKAARWQTQICMQDHYLDSPDHQEPICDFGDYLIEARINDYAFGQPALVRQDLLKFGSLLAANDYVNFHTSYSLLWLQSLVSDYEATGDRTLIDELAPEVFGLLAKFDTWRGVNGLISNAPDYMFMDWVAVDGIECHHPPAVIGQGYMTAFYYRALADGILVAQLRGDATRARDYEQQRAEIKTAFNRELWDAKRGLYRDGKPFQTTVAPAAWLPADTQVETFSPHVNSLAVLYGLAPKDASRAVMQNVMRAAPVNAQPYFYYYIFGALEESGLFDSLAVGQMHRWQINPETDTFAEMWDRGDLSHGWGGAPLIFMSSTILGVKPGSPGFKNVSIRPTLCDLTRAKGVVPTPQGPVSVSWKLTATGMALSLSVPKSSTATVMLPAERFARASAVIDSRTTATDLATPIVLHGGDHEIVVTGTLIEPHSP